MTNHQTETPSALSEDSQKIIKKNVPVDTPPQKPLEVGGPRGPEPTRYGDWEKAGRCSDF